MDAKSWVECEAALFVGEQYILMFLIGQFAEEQIIKSNSERENVDLGGDGGVSFVQ